MEKKITLYDYLVWIAEDETNIDASLIRTELLLNPDVDDDYIMEFYSKYKNSELLHFKEEYKKGDYRLSCYDTKISFYIEGMENGYFEIPDVNGSFLHDNNMIEENDISHTDRDMNQWAVDLLDRYNSASNIKEIAIYAEQMADFIEAFLSKNDLNVNE